MMCSRLSATYRLHPRLLLVPLLVFRRGPVTGHTKFVLPGDTKTGAMSQNTMIFAVYRLGYLSRLTVHGFRRMASTILNEHQFNRDWIEMQLAHAPRDSVRAAYNAAEWLPGRRNMMQWWADYLDGRRPSAAAKGASTR
jgi:integrase